MRNDNNIIKPSAEKISNGKYISKVFIILRSLAFRNSYGPGLNSKKKTVNAGGRRKNATQLTFAIFVFVFFAEKMTFPTLLSTIF